MKISNLHITTSLPCRPVSQSRPRPQSSTKTSPTPTPLSMPQCVFTAFVS